MDRVPKPEEGWLGRLQTRLYDRKLPGEEAQYRMSPSKRRTGDFTDIERRNPRRGGVMLLLYPDGEHWYFPLIRRPDYPGVHGGQVSFPGGKLEQGENALDAALRETEEEIGVPVQTIQVLGPMSRLYIPPSNFLVSPFVGLLEEKPVFVPEPLEVEDIIHARVDHLLETELRKTTSITTGGGFKITAPYFDLEGHIVWGATAMMLSEFAVLLEEVMPA
ncbi:MAG: CoA pyrophosphatase [Cyclobacteriaceae bacterium]